MTQHNTYPPVDIYEHYKSTSNDRKLYQVIGFARHTETDEELVIYIPLYTQTGHAGLRLQARPLTMFLETIELDGEEKPRFDFVGPELV